MQGLADKPTIDLLQPVKRGRGRPVSGQAMTNAERQRRYRQNLKAKKRNVTKNLNQGEGVRIHDAVDILLERLDLLEQQVADLSKRELRAWCEVARLQALIASSMPEQFEPKPFETKELPDECQRYEK